MEVGRSVPLISLKAYDDGMPADKTFLFLYAQLLNSVIIYRDCYGSDSALKERIVKALG